MRKKIVLLICSLLVCSCSSHSGRLVEKQDVTVSPGTVPYRAGTVPYRNQGSDAKVAARRDNALRKIAKFCGPDGYTVTREGSSSTASNMSEVDFRCGKGPTASASGGTLDQPKNSGTVGGANIKANPNVEPAPSDFDRR
jgi:hypothetical protein